MKNQIKKALNLFLVPEFYFFGAVATWFQIWAALFVTGAWRALRTTEVPVIIALADPYWVIVTGIILSFCMTLCEVIYYYTYAKKHDKSFDWAFVTAPWVFTGLANLLILYRWL